VIIVLMGVSGAGKTTVGQLLAADLGWPFYDADDFHPPSNVQAMRAGRALTDADRAAWLDALHRVIRELVHRDVSAVLACSALKQCYRERLIGDDAAIAQAMRFVYLKGTPELIRQRLAARTRHFMPVALLPSQFATLEEPRTAVVVDVSAAPATIVQRIRRALGV
jgi:gluconokinase